MTWTVMTAHDGIVLESGLAIALNLNDKHENRDTLSV